MGKFSCSLRVALVACALGASAIPALAQTEGSDRAVPAAVASKQKAEIARGDPKRWYKESNSDQARLQIQKKEINAAYTEAKNACRKGEAGSRSQCLKDARVAYEQDMRNAKGLVAMAPTSSVTENSGPVDTSGAASTAVGASGAGATGSGTATGTTAGQADAVTGQSGTSGSATSGAMTPPPEKPRSDKH